MVEDKPKGLIVTHGPHIRSRDNIRRIMTDVLLALMPVSLASAYFFGWRAVLLMVVSVIVAMVTEAFAVHGRSAFKLLAQPAKLYSDGSAAVTGLILAHIVTPMLPIWMIVVGSALAILIGKQVYGGLGQNVFNPALVGRVILFVAFPAAMGQKWMLLADAATGATPLVNRSTSYFDLFIGRIGGCLGETSVLAILVGAAYLLWRGHIGWRIPVAYLGTTAVLSALLGADPVYALLAGGVVYGAFFMATDMVTTPVTKLGRLVFGLGCGIITVVIRELGALPEGVMFSILVMNATTPIIDRLTKPRVFGGGTSA